MKRAVARRLGIVVLIALLPLTMADSCKKDKNCKPDQSGFSNCTHGGCNC